MKKTHRSLIVSSAAQAIAGLVVFSAFGAFADTQDEIRQLKEQLSNLDQKIKVLERQRENERDVAVEKAKTTAVVTAGAGGFSIRSADTNFVLRLRGYVQGDGRFYPNDNAAGTANDTFLMRRVRPIFEGTVYDKYDFRVMFDFGSGVTASSANNAYVQDAYVNARFYPWLQLRVGKDKEPVGLERIQSGSNLLFVERSYPTQLLPNRDVGVQLRGDVLENRLEYAVGVFNGVANGGSGDIETADDDKDIAARVFAQPFKNSDNDWLRGLGVGVAGTIGNQEGALRTYVSPGQQKIFGYRSGAGTNAATANIVTDGELWRLTPQFYYYKGSFGLFGEYAIANQSVRRDAGTKAFEDLQHTAWQLAGSYFLTGEENGFKAVTPLKPFSIGSGGWGAWELKARFSQLRLDSKTFPLYADPAQNASEATSWAVGVNWHLNKFVKFNLDYEQTDFQGGASAPLTAKGEQAILTRAQVSF